MKTTQIARLIFLGTVLLSLSSCIKDNLNEPTTSTNAQTMKELIAPKAFKWNTAQTVVVNITGLPTIEDVRATLSVGDSQNTFYSGLHLMSENHILTLEIPAVDKELKLKFGATEQIAIIKDGKASFSFIPAITDIIE
jgi:hypothetical protein